MIRNRLKDLLKTPEGERYEGKLTRYDHFDAISSIDDTLNRVPEDFTIEDLLRFMESCLEHFMTMNRQMKFSNGVIHRLLLQELHHDGPTNEMRFMLGNHSSYRTQPCMLAWNDIQQRYFTGIDEVSFQKLRVVLSLGEFQQLYDAVKLYLLYMLNWILMGLDERVKIPVWQFRLVKDLDAFNAFL
ncbi:hypothetical protein Ddye_020880 [Dipteronia dyeriana]|uniref:Uncharacterized protein n=1 Tax=Dipteronia dyeriana TaxID=168575 RepID=A0AAD9U1M2_9ROSI|nr:hypothetical protein Ddye_020880 [Dipteronia dyeriana]